MSDLTGPDVATAAPARRPSIIWLLSIIVVVVAALGLLGGLLLLSEVSDGESHGRSINGAVRVIAVISLACSVAQAAGGVLVFFGRNVGRYVVMGVAGLVVLSNLFSLLSGTGIQGCLGIVVNGAMIASMMRQDVRDWCKR
jgi:hypothetical protein